MQIEDVYKFLYQGTLGIEHLLQDTLAARKYLEEEWRQIAAVPREPLLEILSPDSQWVRLNLRAYKARGGTTAALWQLMMRSAGVHEGKKVFVRRWQEFVRMVDERLLPFDNIRLREFDRRIVARQYPVSHHSETYLKDYRPAYRVLLRSVVDFADVDKKSILCPR